MRGFRERVRLGSLWVLILLAACGGESEPPTPPPAPTRSPATPPVVAPTPPTPAPTTPLDLASGNADAGKGLYVQYCATCHGEDGRAGTPMAKALDPTPANHADGDYMNPLTDEHLFRVIKNGGPAVGRSPLMAPWGGTLDDAQIVDVIAFVRTLADPPYSR